MDLYSIGVGAVAVLLLVSHKRVGEEERAVVFRLNRFLRIAGPGSLIAVPGLDKVARVELPKQVPHWRSLTPEQLEDAIKGIVRSSGYEMPDDRGRPTRR